MKQSIVCKTTNRGEQSLYLKANGKEYFLFSQAYRKSVKSFFGNETTVDRALDYTLNNGAATRKTMQKLRAYIPYVEKEYDVCVLRKSRKTRRPHKENRKSVCDDDFFAA